MNREELGARIYALHCSESGLVPDWALKIADECIDYCAKQLEKAAGECEHHWIFFGWRHGYETWRCNKCEKVESSRPKKEPEPTKSDLQNAEYDSNGNLTKVKCEPIRRHAWPGGGKPCVNCGWYSDENPEQICYGPKVKPEPPKPERVAREVWVSFHSDGDPAHVWTKRHNAGDWPRALFREVLPEDEHDKR